MTTRTSPLFARNTLIFSHVPRWNWIDRIYGSIARSASSSHKQDGNHARSSWRIGLETVEVGLVFTILTSFGVFVV